MSRMNFETFNRILAIQNICMLFLECEEHQNGRFYLF